MIKKFGLALFASVFISSCAGSIKNLPVSGGVEEIPCCGTNDRQNIQIQYLGVGGFLLRRGKDAILTAPFFSNPSIVRVALWHIQSNPGKIDQFLPPVEDVEAILVGHAHYDHLMDIPYIAQKRAPKAQVFGSQTMKNILSAVLPEERLVALDSEAATFEKPGKWQYVAGTRIRFMAIQSEHAPHFWGVKLFSGEVSEKLDTLPERAWGWKEGPTFAYLIDFMGEDGSIDFRIHYQDAASNPPYGFPPAFEPRDQTRVDVAIVCVPGFDQVRNYPEGIIQHIKPRFVILGHWEDFFRPRTEDPEDLKVVPLTDPKVFIARMKKVLSSDSNWAMPRPGSWLRLKPDKF